MKLARLWIGLVAFTSILSSGCDAVPEGQLRTVPVEVTVLYKGQPVEEAIVTFAGPDGTPPAFGRTDAHGKARMSTYSNADGAALGTYSVSVVKQEFANGQENLAENVAEDATEEDMEDVSEDSPDYEPSPGASPLPVIKDLLPERFALPTTSGLTANVADGENELTLDLGQ